MTKEEILEKRRHIIGNQLMPILSDTIYNMMDEYAKQQAIAYDIWKRVNGYTLHYPNYEYVKLIITGDKAVTSLVPIDEVYAQFVEQQSK
jgi:hypothetical protein